MIDHRKKSIGYCYIVSYASGIIKVGKTNTPYGRFKSYHREAENSQDTVERMMITDIIDGYHEVERSIISEFSKVANLAKGKEWFCGISLEESVFVFERLGIKISSVSLEQTKPLSVSSLLKADIKPVLTGAQITLALLTLRMTRPSFAKGASISVTTIVKLEKARFEYPKVRPLIMKSVEAFLIERLNSINWHFTESGGIAPLPSEGE